MKAFFALLFGLSLSISLPLHAATYYVDSQNGSDSNAGTSPKHAWKTLQKVNVADYLPGDHILLHSGSRWQGKIVLHSSGAKGNPILVDSYGKGALPRIDGKGVVENVIELSNVEQIEVRHLEITNKGSVPAVRRAVLIAAIGVGTLHHVAVTDLYIHDVNGTNARKETGGILFRTGGEKQSRFDDLEIARNIIWNVDRSAIVGQSSQISRAKWFPSLHVVIRDNYAEDIGGDGIVPWATDGALIEHNVVMHCNHRADSYNAGIWPWSTDNSLFQLNEAAFTHTTRDGEGFDSDYNSRNTRFAYNYSHDNDGGFMLICTPVKRNGNNNIGNTGTVIRHNISRNDHTRIFNLSGADNTLVEQNAIYIAPQDDVQILLVSNWSGWSNGAIFRGNKFDAAGIGRYGHEVEHLIDGTYRIAPGWGGAANIRFDGNHYTGRQIDPPGDPTGVTEAQSHASRFQTPEPLFNPAHPETFQLWLKNHRNWMLQLFRSEFGNTPHLETPSPFSSDEEVGRQ